MAKSHPQSIISLGSDGQLTVNTRAVKVLLQNTAIIAVMILAFFALDRSGVVAQVATTSSSSLPALFVLGFVASLSTCAALVGGLLMSQPKTKIAHVSFHAGRIVAFIVGGGLLGLIGAAFQINFQTTALLVIVVCLLMILSSLQVLNVEWANKCKLLIPSPIRSKMNDIEGLKYLAPLGSGAVTFLLPCSLTVIAQGFALNSGGFVNGSLAMFSFALGTLPMLLTISISSWKLSVDHHVGMRFQHITALVVIVLAMYNINANLNILGLPSLSDIQFGVEAAELPEIVNGQQTIMMSATPNGYSPTYFKVRAGIPVRWQINGSSIPSCASTIQANGLLSKAEVIESGENTLTFIAPTSGTYKFTCAMGMFSGIIEAV